MKKYLIFISSFAVLYLLFQISSGAILTLLYTPNLSGVSSIPGQEVIAEKASIDSLFIIFLSSTIAFLLSQKVGKTSKALANV